MTSESMTLINDIASLLNQLEQALGAEYTTQEPAMDVNEEITTEPLEDVVEEAKKGLETTPSDGATANDSTEEIIDDSIPDTSAQGVDEVAKQLALILNKMNGKKTAKSVSSTDDTTVLKMLNKIAKAINGLAQKQNETDAALGNILDGFGISEQIEKAYNVEKTEKIAKGYNNTNDVNKTVDYLIEQLGGIVEKSKDNEEVKYMDNKQVIRKTLRDPKVLTGMLRRK